MNNNMTTSATVNNSVLNNNLKPFNLENALKTRKALTRDGRKVTVICVSRNKILATVHSNLAMYNDRTMKFNLDGTRFTNNIDSMDLMSA